VFGSGEVADDAPLIDSGVDTPEAIEFRNRLAAQFGVNLPNTLTSDYPTIAAVAGFLWYIALRTEVSPTHAIKGIDSAPTDSPVVKLNERNGVPLVLIPGGLQYSDAFAGLAKMVPLPLWALEWPTTGDGHESLSSVAAWAVDWLRKEQAQGPYLLGGYSMGGALALEMAAQLEAVGEPVEAVVLIDTRTIPPIDLTVRLEDVPGFVKNDESQQSQLEPDFPARLFLDHTFAAGSASPAPVIFLRAMDLTAVGPIEHMLSATFQDDATVVDRLRPTGRTVLAASVPGRHFNLCDEPQVGNFALQLCAQVGQLRSEGRRPPC
jgi:thioesterase domain-containing protein